MNYSNNPATWFLTDGISVYFIDPVEQPQLEGNNVVQIVADLPWGPVDEIQKFDASNAQGMADALFGKVSNPEEWSGAQALLGKSWQTIEIVRIDATGAVAASRTVGANGYSATAKYKGAAGNQIEIKHTDLGAGNIQIDVRWNDYSNQITGALADVATFEDDYLVFAGVGTADTVEASDADYVNLSAGANGAPTDTDYLGGATDVSGLRLFESSEEGAITILDDYTSAAAVTALRAHAALKRGVVVYDAASGDQAANIAAAGAYQDDRAVPILHRWKATVNNVEKDVSLVPFAASILSGQPPQFSLADFDGAQTYLKSLTTAAPGVVLSRAQWIAADDAGGNMLEALDGGGYKFHAGLTSDPNNPLISSRRVKDYVVANVVRLLAPFNNKPNMAFYDNAALATVQAAMRDMIGDPERDPFSSIFADGGVKLDPNPPANTKRYLLAIRMHGENRYTLLAVTAGIGIDIEELGFSSVL